MRFISENERRINVTASLVAIFAGLLFGLIIMLITNPLDAIPAFFTILTGGFQDGLRSIGAVLFYATPLIFTGLSVGFAFRTGLFNIGAAGQLMVGGFVAIYIGVRWTFLPSGIHWLIAFLCAGIAGGIWASIPGLLKAYRNVHEVVSTIMMNYIGLYFVHYLIKQTVYNLERNETMPVARSAELPNLGLNEIFGRQAFNSGFFFAIITVIIIYIILEKTTFGFELKAVGFNKDASKYAGINEKRSIILSMVIAGVLSGLAGGTIYLSSTGRHIEIVDVLVQEGFTGIPVALIGLSHPVGIFFAGIFMGYIRQGGFYMQLYNFVPEIIDIIIASIIYFSALVIIFKEVIIRLTKRHQNKEIKLKRGDVNG